MRPNINRQHGFTLVELAIVLIIIGLLLGGILKGQELINSARVRSLADQSAGVQAAYYGFVDRYRQIPGDLQKGDGPLGACTLLGKASFPKCDEFGGNLNGRIDEGNWQEASAVWAHLAAAGFISGSYPGGPDEKDAYKSKNPLRAPINPFGGFLLLARTDDYQGNHPVRLNLVLGRNLPVTVARDLDVKLDDGQPQTGVLRAAQLNGTGFNDVAEGDTGCVDANGAWDITKDSQDCNAVSLY